MLIAIVVAVVILFALVAWSRYHKSQTPPAAPMHQQTRLMQPLQRSSG